MKTHVLLILAIVLLDCSSKRRDLKDCRLKEIHFSSNEQEKVNTIQNNISFLLQLGFPIQAGDTQIAMRDSLVIKRVLKEKITHKNLFNKLTIGTYNTHIFKVCYAFDIIQENYAKDSISMVQQMKRAVPVLYEIFGTNDEEIAKEIERQVLASRNKL